jgi:FdhD protein
MAKNAETPVRYYRYRLGRWEIVDAHVIMEAPVSLTVNGEVWLTFMCTPTDVEALAVGFLFNEGWIQSAAEIEAFSVCASGDIVDVWLNRSLEKPQVWKRTTGCSGGLTSPEPVPVQLELDAEEKISPAQVMGVMAQLMENQELYRSARGVHASAVSDGSRILARAEDIGRHNTLDKIAGILLLEGITEPRQILVTTGRISSEMLQKAARIGTPVVVSHTAPNALSIQAAQEMDITLIGYARRDQFQVYTHPERIQGAPLASTLPALRVDQEAPAAD